MLLTVALQLLPLLAPSRQARDDRTHTRSPYSLNSRTDLIDRLAVFEVCLWKSAPKVQKRQDSSDSDPPKLGLLSESRVRACPGRSVQTYQGP